MKTLKFLCIIVFAIAITSCEKEGIGGKGQIKGQTYTVSNGKVLKGTTIFIKYGATSWSGHDVSAYDDSNPADTDGEFEFKELRKGDYYLYAIGVDNGQLVSGGVRVILNDAELKENLILTLAP